MRLDVGPIAASSASAWIEFAHRVFGEAREVQVETACPCPQMCDDVAGYLRRWQPGIDAEVFVWHAEVDPEEIEYVTTALFHLDGRLSGVPAEGRAFHLMLVLALLRSLDQDSPARAAFADQLRSRWPSAMAAR